MTFLRERKSRRSTRSRNGFDPVNYAAVRWATDTFQNLVSDGNYANFLNYDTLATPTPADDMVVAAGGNNGSVQCNNLTDMTSGSNAVSGGLIQVFGTATGVNFNGVNCVSSGGASLDCVTCNFSADQGSMLTVNTSGACVFGVGLATQINDNGSGSWGAFTFSGTINSTGSGIVLTAASTFSGTVNASAISGSGAAAFAVVNCNNINAPAATFGGTITQTGSVSSLICGTINSPVTWTAVTEYSNVACTSSTKFGTTLSLVLPQSGGTVTVAVPSQNDVISTAGGNWVVPATNTVLNVASGGSTYGVSGGTAGTATLTSANNVIHGSGAFGVAGNSITPNWYRPNDEASDAAAAQWIANGKAFGVGGASTGTLAGGGLLVNPGMSGGTR